LEYVSYGEKVNVDVRKQRKGSKERKLLFLNHKYLTHEYNITFFNSMISREYFINRGALNSMELRFESITQLSGVQEVQRFQAGATSWRCAAGGEIKKVFLQS